MIDIYTHTQDSTYVFDDLEEREIFLGPEGIFNKEIQWDDRRVEYLLYY